MCAIVDTITNLERGGGRYLMKSIRHKLVLFSLLCALLGTAITTAVGLLAISQTQNRSSEQILTLTCLEESSDLNQTLLNIEGSVEACSDIITSELSSLEPDCSKEEFSACVDDLEKLVGSIAETTPGVCTYYVRVSQHDDNEEPDGFFYTRKTLDSPLAEEPITPIKQYDPSDNEHVGWYYQPAAARHALWMDPYHNQNIDIYMVSYVIPLYVDGVFVGVAGMDVDFRVIVNAIRQISSFETGTSFLVSQQGVIHYHPSLEAGTSITSYAPELDAVVSKVESLPEGKAECIDYETNGTKKKLAYCNLRNNMVLMLTADASEINAPANDLLRRCALTALILSALAVLVVVKAADRMTEPLMKLTSAADQIAQGNMDVELPPVTDDEIGVLTKSFDVTVQSLRRYISGMQDKAYRDSLTMVRNKTAYDEAARELNGQLQSGSREFALLMLDVNYLKTINDRYGHDCGDEYLRTCCQMACHVFEHSPVFRIGGDEFIVILRGGDYQRREELLAELDRRMAASMDEADPWHRVSLAKGMACCTPTDRSVDEIFKRADQAMYENKRAMKAQR